MSTLAIPVDRPRDQSWYFYALMDIVSLRRYRFNRVRKGLIERFEALNHSGLSTELILRDLILVCVAPLELPDCVIYLRGTDRAVLKQVAALGNKANTSMEVMYPMEIPVGAGIVGSVAEKGETERLGNATSDDRYIMDDDIRHSELAVPIVFKGQVIGVIDTEHPRKYFFRRYHQQYFEAMARAVTRKLGE